MWDAVAFPVSPWKVSRQERVPPVPLRTSVAVKVPVALARTAFGFGTSCAALSRAVRPRVVALPALGPAVPRPAQIPAANIAGTATPLATSRRPLIFAPPCQDSCMTTLGPLPRIAQPPERSR
jgi:hypothetical protein